MIMAGTMAGVIATTGCPSGEVNMWLRAGKEDRARQAAADFQDIFVDCMNFPLQSP